MPKKLFSFIFILMIMLIPAVNAYVDIDEHWAKETIESLSRINIVKGYIDNTFKPDNYMTRAEFVTVINRLIGASGESDKYIPDNNSKSWYYTEIRKAVQAGLIEGDNNGNVYPNREITREEAATILSRAFYINSSIGNIYSKENEDTPSEWAKESFGTFVKYGYIKGYEDGKYKPKSNITRAEVLVIINRIFSEVILSGEYTSNINGNALVTGENITLSNIYIGGNLIITEKTSGKVSFNNVDIKGNLILRIKTDLNTKDIVIGGNIINLYENISLSGTKYYEDERYGITFSVPENVTIMKYEDKTNKRKIDYDTEDLIIVKIDKDDSYHFLNFEAAKKKFLNYDNIYVTVEKGKKGIIEYGWYKDSTNLHILLIKRFDVIYTIFFYNATNETIIDNAINTMKFTEGEYIHEHKEITYKNANLKLKFKYLDYIGVDDSYNTGIVFEGNTYFKLFIQINNITDLENYSTSEIKLMLSTFANADGKVISSKNIKVQQYDAIEFIIKNNDKLSKSLYVIVGNNLYNFIFTGEEEKVNSIGFELFDNVVKSLEI